MPWVFVAWPVKFSAKVGNSTIRIFSVVLWIALLIGVSLTYSRGPVAGAMVGTVVFLLGAWMLNWPQWKILALAIAGGLGLMVGLIWLSAAGDRFSPSFISTDGSVANRLELWKGASQMVFLRPLNGLGLGEGGYFFSQWYQPQHLEYSYTSLLNSWLEIGVESGLPALAAGIFLCLFALGLVLFRQQAENTTEKIHVAPAHRWTHVSVPAAASLVTLMLCGVTSSVHAYKGIPWMIALNLVVLGACGVAWRRKIRWRPLFAVSAAITCLALVGLWIFSEVASKEYFARVEISGNGVVKLIRKSPSHNNGRPLGILCDRELMGRLYGKRLREMLATGVTYDVFIIPDPRKLLPETNAWLPAKSDLAAFGRSVTSLNRFPMENDHTYYLIHPVGKSLFHDTPGRKIVWKPQYDLEYDMDEKNPTDDLTEFRRSSSLGGACNRRVIEQAKGFFW